MPSSVTANGSQLGEETPASRSAFQLVLPPSSSDVDGNNRLKNNGVVVVIGANGSGKTRMGSWLEFESEHRDVVHRVAAQRSLSMPPSSRPTSIDSAESMLFYGVDLGPQPRNINHKRNRRWGEKPNTILLSDFEPLMVYLFSDLFEESVKYKREAKDPSNRKDPPETKLDIVQRVSESVLPHRELVIGGGKVETKLKGQDAGVYNASEMSDGERVVFYLIGECLAAPRNAVIVIDEPEVHRHKSIQAALWDAIEAERPDCLFVYLTHDLDFASSRVGAPKVCLNRFDGSNWEWYVAPENNEIPEDVFLQIVGGRKPVLFVEGDNSSLDHLLFSHLYPNFTIVPSGSATHVIHATRTFARFKHLHRLECRGIIDRDFRIHTEVENLQQMNVFVLEISEIENLFLHEAVLQQLAADLLREDFPSLMGKIQELVFGELTREKDRVVSAMTASAIETHFTHFNAKAQGVAELEQALETLIMSIDVGALYSTVQSNVDEILSHRDYHEAIKLYNNKGLI